MIGGSVRDRTNDLFHQRATGLIGWDQPFRQMPGNTHKLDTAAIVATVDTMWYWAPIGVICGQNVGKTRTKCRGLIAWNQPVTFRNAVDNFS
jgi:hypothetical protein